MDQQQLRRLLEQLTFSVDLPSSVLAEVAAIALLQRFPAGEILFREGAHSEVVYLVASGRVALDMHVPGRGDVRVLSLAAGDIVGWSAIIGDHQMTTRAEVLEDSELIAISGPKLRSLCERNAAIGYPVMRQMAIALSRRLVATRLQLLDLFGDGAATR